MSDIVKEYIKITGGEPIAMCNIMGNEILAKKFDNDIYRVYEYCIDNKKTWEEVLEYKEEEGVLY